MDTLKPFMKQKIDRTLAIIKVMEVNDIDYEEARRIHMCRKR